METCSSGEDLIIKARKPYTITKQRERWTEEEHNRFLEALKLYGRAWQRIEEHIGTKTAVQIRSHAQKFFTKLEKEAVIKGRPLGQAHNIDIPPPRPKRKPSNPYPRKTGVGLPVSSLGPKDGKLLNKDKQVLDLEHDPTHEEPTATGAFQRMNETSDEGNCSEVLSLFQEAPSASLSSATNTFALKSTSTCKDFVSPVIETNDKITKECISTSESKEGKQLERPYPINMDLKIGRDIELYLENHCITKQAEIAPGKETKVQKSEKEFSSETSEALSTHGYPRHIPVHVLDGNTEKCMPAPSSSVTNQIPLINQSGGINGNATPFINRNVYAASESAKSSTHQSIPILHPPFYPFQNNQDAFRSPFDISATFWSHIISTLVQNPSVHAAAILAASFGPCPDDSAGEILLGRCPTRHMSPTPSLAALAATTVAAASAWWASHGLLPFCPPIHPTFPLNPLPTTTIPTTESTQEALGDNKERIAKDQTSVLEDQQVLHPEVSAAPKPGSPGSKSSSSSSGSEETVNPVPHSAELKAVEQEKNPVSSTDDPNKEKKARKLVERSSCGSNTPSSSEIETDMLKKQGEGQELSNEAELGHLGGEATNRRSRSTGNAYDSWKSVSEEGRLAFQALFSREVLPQSFSTPHNLRINEPLNNSVAQELKQEVSKKDEDHKLELELYATTQTPFNFSLAPQQDDSSRSHYNTGKGLLVSELLEHGKLKTDRTGFKPYKRCSVVAKESRSISSSGQTGEKGAKRIRLEGGAST